MDAISDLLWAPNGNAQRSPFKLLAASGGVGEAADPPTSREEHVDGGGAELSSAVMRRSELWRSGGALEEPRSRLNRAVSAVCPWLRVCLAFPPGPAPGDITTVPSGSSGTADKGRLGSQLDARLSGETREEVAVSC